MGEAIDNSKVIDNITRVVIFMSRPESTIILVKNSISSSVLQLDFVLIAPRKVWNIL